MEIETLAYQIRPEHVGQCVRQFKILITGSTKVADIPSLMKQTLRKLLGDYEIELYKAEISRGNILKRMRSEQKVYPLGDIFELKDAGVISNCSTDNFNIHLA